MKTDIKEYAEEMEVEIYQLDPEEGERCKHVTSDSTYKAHINKRFVIRALNESGYNKTEVDLIDVINYVKTNMPELLEDNDAPIEGNISKSFAECANVPGTDAFIRRQKEES